MDIVRHQNTIICKTTEIKEMSLIICPGLTQNKHTALADAAKTKFMNRLTASIFYERKNLGIFVIKDTVESSDMSKSFKKVRGCMVYNRAHKLTPVNSIHKGIIAQDDDKSVSLFDAAGSKLFSLVMY